MRAKPLRQGGPDGTLRIPEGAEGTAKPGTRKKKRMNHDRERRINEVSWKIRNLPDPTKRAQHKRDWEVVRHSNALEGDEYVPSRRSIRRAAR